MLVNVTQVENGRNNIAQTTNKLTRDMKTIIYSVEKRITPH